MPKPQKIDTFKKIQSEHAAGRIRGSMRFFESEE
jgi:hypothetical protein